MVLTVVVVVVAVVAIFTPLIHRFTIPISHHNIQFLRTSLFFHPPGTFLQHLNFEKSYSLQFLLSDIGANVADLYGSKLDIPFMGKFANRLTFIIGSDGKIEKVMCVFRQLT